MKTKEEIIKHLFENSYDNEEVKKIFKYLEDNGLAEKLEDPKFEDFKKWFEEKDEDFNVEDIEVGDYLHLKDGQDCVVIDVFYGEKIATIDNGVSSFPVKFEGIERGCTEDEVSDVDRHFEKRGLYFNDEYYGLLPIGVDFEDVDDEEDDECTELLEKISGLCEKLKLSFNEE